MKDNYLKLRHFLLVALMLCLSSCGFFSEDPVPNAGTYDQLNLGSSCNLNSDKFSEMLENDIESELKCLEDSLIKFTQYVKRENANSINKRELGAFVDFFFEDSSDAIIRSLGLVFKLNMLFLADSSDQIQTKNITPFIRILIDANKQAIKIMDVVDKMKANDRNFWTHRKEFQTAIESLSQKTLQIIENRPLNGHGSRLNVQSFLDELSSGFKSFSLEGKTQNILLKVKKLLVGGSEKDLTTAELVLLIKKLPILSKVAFDLGYATEQDFHGKKDQYRFYRHSLEEMEKTFFKHAPNEPIISQSEFLSYAKQYLSAEDAEYYQEMFVRTKETFIDQKEEDQDQILFSHLHSFINYGKMALVALASSDDLQEATKEIKKLDYQNWQVRREDFLDKLHNTQLELLSLTKKAEDFPLQVNILPFALFINQKVDSLKYEEPFVNAVFNIKKLFLGGERETLTYSELRALIDKIPELAALYFDLSQFPKDKLSQQEQYKYFLQDIDLLKRTLFKNNRYLPIIELDEVETILKVAAPDFDFNTYKETMALLKPKLIGGYGDVFSIVDIKAVSEIAENMLEKLLFFNTSYDLYQNELAQNTPIRSLPYRHHDNFKRFTFGRIKSLRQEFIFQVVNYRQFRGKSGLSFYGDTISRNKMGFIETLVIREAFELLAPVFGHIPEGKKEYEFNLDNVNDLLATFRPFMEKKGLWSKHPETFARNTLLLGDLFQNQSDGSMTLNKHETAEYGSLVFSAIKMGDQLEMELKKKCRFIEAGVDEPGFPVPCYRQHYFSILIDKLGYKKQLPKLNHYLHSAPLLEVKTFLEKVEGFARDFNDPKLPMTKRDLMLLTGALLNIESTMVRFDRNQNNQLDPFELDLGFPIYQEAIVAVAKLDESKLKYTKSIFLYMIKEMEKPSTIDLLNFHYNPLISKEIVAKRINVGTLLYYLVNQ